MVIQEGGLMVSAEAFNRYVAERVRLNRAILKNPYWFLPVDDKGHEVFMPVGRGVKSSDLCGKHVSFVVCKNVEGHKGVVVNGVDCSGKVVVRHKHWWCHKPTCPVCFNRGWSVRQARSVERGVDLGFGKIEHVVVSVPSEDYSLREKVLRKKCRDALFDRGVVGGCMIFHGYRVDRERGCLVWSHHYHVLGFIEGGFDRCRDCVHERGDCRSCDGFKGREVRGYARDGYLVKVLAERKTVFGTAWYQLNHSTIRTNVKRPHACTWFGVCSYRKLKVTVEYKKSVCPICQHELVEHLYCGRKPDVLAVFSSDRSSCGKREFFGDVEEDGRRVWVERVRSEHYG